MANLDKEIVDGAQMLSLLLVFLSVVFGIKYDKIIALLKEKIPPPPDHVARETLRMKLKGAILVHVGPIGVPSIVLIALLGPDAYRIAAASSLSLINFSLVRSLFEAVTLAVAAATLWCAWAVVALLRRRRMMPPA